MDTITVADTVVVLMTEASRSWFTLNAYWLVPLITILVTLWGIRKSTETSIKNTNDQIENQNKENHRPYLLLKSPKVVEIKKEEIDFFIEIKHSDEKRNKHSHFENLTFENVGYGIARDVKLISMDDNCKITEKNSRLSDKKLVLPILDIKHGHESEVLIELNLDEKFNRFPIAVVYRDLNKNTYVSTMLVGDMLNNKISYTFTPEGSVRSENHSRLSGLDIREVIQKYENYYEKE